MSKILEARKVNDVLKSVNNDHINDLSKETKIIDAALDYADQLETLINLQTRIIRMTKLLLTTYESRIQTRIKKHIAKVRRQIRELKKEMTK